MADYSMTNLYMSIKQNMDLFWTIKTLSQVQFQLTNTSYICIIAEELVLESNIYNDTKIVNDLINFLS